ncbi:LysR family transcriptional regulator [Roseibium polysiphoniae]|uniref:LysR family transcriptional regulator n=1 Tax=Roseibium polysiphoniae TaxID=2571221 RepID=A0A944CF66_9HYPH|nr:LysR family transcriptional regulator [Roseibium polysiphoniae]MBS8261106.1 LysR family transcriptional regulator [Roseibium polysiphoniae]
MNWQAISFDWNNARAFLATAEEGSFSAAARVLGLTQPTLGRQVAALEAELGVVLFERVGRSLKLTPFGTELLDHVRGMAEAARCLSLAASGQAQSSEGKVCISASDLMAAYLLPELIGELRRREPGIHIEVLASNALSDLRQREADIALRHVRPDHPELIARLIREMCASFYASPRYLAEHGRPETFEDMASHALVGFVDDGVLLDHLNRSGVPVTSANIICNSADGNVAWQMVREGLGIGIMADDIAERCPDVERLFPGIDPFRYPLWLVTHRELNTSRRIRLVFDFLVDAFKQPRPVKRRAADRPTLKTPART